MSFTPKRLRQRAGFTKEPFDAVNLPDKDKKALCRALLSEFGVINVRESGNGELIHSCPLNLGGHKNGDLNPSASLNWKKLTFHCFGCQNSGGLLWFIGTCRGTSGQDARGWLKDQTTFEDGDNLGALLVYFDSLYSVSERHSAPMPKMDPRVLEPWLWIHPYMTEVRKIPEDNLVALRIGWNESSNRIVIPHFWEGNLVGWQTRRIVNDGSSKYLSSPDMPKDLTVYHYDPKEKSAVVVEAPISVVSKIHVCHMEATFGASVTDRQIQRLATHPRVTLCFDNDEAGWRGTRHVGEALQPYSEVWVVENPWAADPADMDDQTFASLVGEAVPYAIWQPPKRVQEWRAA